MLTSQQTKPKPAEMETRIIELSGLITKEEVVCNVSAYVLAHTTVLESCHPMPGYFGKNSPDGSKPRSIFILLDMDYEPLLLARKLKALSEARQHKCYGSFGKISIKRKTFTCIRIKNLDCFAAVPDIQNALTESGFRMLKHRTISDLARIEIHKAFKVTPLMEGIYEDALETNRFYMTIPGEIKWEDFLKVTNDVRNNLDNNLFDAALGFFWRFDGPEDVVRIYDHNHSPERMMEIRQAYLSAIERNS